MRINVRIALIESLVNSLILIETLILTETLVIVWSRDYGSCNILVTDVSSVLHFPLFLKSLLPDGDTNGYEDQKENHAGNDDDPSGIEAISAQLINVKIL